MDFSDFHSFRATRREISREDFVALFGDDMPVEDATGVLLYRDDTWISALPRGRYHLLLENCEWDSDYRAPLEWRLWQWSREDVAPLDAAQMQAAVAMLFRLAIAEDVRAIDLCEMDTFNRARLFDPCCSSHNFCDANMPMAAALEAVTGRPYLGEGDDGLTVADVDLWNRAWDMARLAGFSAAPVTLSVQDGTLDSFVRDYCMANEIECEGGAFGIMFSGGERFTIAESVELIERGADIYRLRLY